MEWENIFAYDISDKGQYPKYIKNLYNSTPKNNPNTSIKKWEEHSNRHFPKEHIKMANST